MQPTSTVAVLRSRRSVQPANAVATLAAAGAYGLQAPRTAGSPPEASSPADRSRSRHDTGPSRVADLNGTSSTHDDVASSTPCFEARRYRQPLSKNPSADSRPNLSYRRFEHFFSNATQGFEQLSIYLRVYILN